MPSSGAPTPRESIPGHTLAVRRGRTRGRSQPRCTSTRSRKAFTAARSGSSRVAQDRTNKNTTRPSAAWIRCSAMPASAARATSVLISLSRASRSARAAQSPRPFVSLGARPLRYSGSGLFTCGRSGARRIAVGVGHDGALTRLVAWPGAVRRHSRRSHRPVARAPAGGPPSTSATR